MIESEITQISFPLHYEPGAGSFIIVDARDWEVVCNDGKCIILRKILKQYPEDKEDRS